MEEVLRMSSRVNNANRINDRTHSLEVSGSMDDIDDDVFEVDGDSNVSGPPNPENSDILRPESSAIPVNSPSLPVNPSTTPETQDLDPPDHPQPSPSPDAQEILEIFANSENIPPSIMITLPETDTAEETGEIPESASPVDGNPEDGEVYSIKNFYLHIYKIFESCCVPF